MNLETARRNMVEQQIRTWEVLDQEVLDLMLSLRREDFVPPAYARLAYAETMIPLGSEAVMLPPTLEAKLLQALQLKKTDRVLEIGTGSGYMAALLGARSQRVQTIEIDPQLAATARRKLQDEGIDNVTVVEGNGLQGFVAGGPFDVIVLSGSVPEVPATLLDQLKPEGRLLAVVGEAPLMEARLISKLPGGHFRTVTLFETRIPPLRGLPPKNRFVF